jgi:hypothetical protein
MKPWLIAMIRMYWEYLRNEMSADHEETMSSASLVDTDFLYSSACRL